MADLQTNLQQILDEKTQKIIPENIKKGVQIFDVVGTLESGGSSTGGVKLFETEEEMQADENAKDGDLAVVYREEIKNMTADSQTQFLTFPEIVTLPQAFTSSAFGMLRAVDESVMFDGSISLTQDEFTLDAMLDRNMIRVSYTSSDGIAYTRSTFSGSGRDLTNPIDLGTIVYYEPMEPWNDNLGYFMQIGGKTFEGLFECKYVPVKPQGIVLDNLTLSDGDVIGSNPEVLNYNIDDFSNLLIRLGNYVKDNFNYSRFSRYPFSVLYKNNNISLVTSTASSKSTVVLLSPYFDNNVLKGMKSSVHNNTIASEFKFDMNSGDFISRNDYDMTEYDTIDSLKYYYTDIFNGYNFIATLDYNSSNQNFIVEYSCQYTSSGEYNTVSSGDIFCKLDYKYFNAPNQLTATSENI